jgi:hypothetical protein
MRRRSANAPQRASASQRQVAMSASVQKGCHQRRPSYRAKAANARGGRHDQGHALSSTTCRPTWAGTVGRQRMGMARLDLHALSGWMSVSCSHAAATRMPDNVTGQRRGEDITGRSKESLGSSDLDYETSG